MSTIISDLRALLQNYIPGILVTVASLSMTVIVGMFFRRLYEKSEHDKSVKFNRFAISFAVRVVLPLLYVGSIFLGCRYMHLSNTILLWVDRIALGFVLYYSIKFISLTAEFSLKTSWFGKLVKGTNEKSVSGILFFLKIFLWVIGIIFFLDNLGVKISTIVAGLGIGGVAVALAAQTVLGDLFSYFTILLDKPFETGDFIIVDSLMGTVENIGLKSTRIRSIDGDQIVMSNTNLTGTRVRNYKHMTQRRIAFKLAVSFKTTTDKLAMIPDLIRGIVMSMPHTLFERAHFMSFGDTGFVFEIVYFVDTSDYLVYMDMQQEINLRILVAFDREGIRLALPTRVVRIDEAPQKQGKITEGPR